LISYRSETSDVTAVSGIVTYYGDGSQLTGIESGVVNFVASGAIANGQTVVINTDGTVGIVTQTSSADPSAGTAVIFNSGVTDSKTSIAFDSNSNKVVIAYCDTSNSSRGTAIVGTVSGTSISFGSEVVYNTGSTDDSVAVFDSTNGKVVIVYRDSSNGNYGTAIVGTVSGTSISFGSEVVFNSGNTSHIAAVFDSTNGKVVISYRDHADSGKGKAIVGTVSGTSISFGSEVQFKGTGVYYVASAYDSTNGKVVIAYTDDANSSRGAAIVGTVSGTSISFGSEVIYETGTIQSGTTPAATFDSTNGKVVIVYRDENNSNYGTAIVGTVSGTSISFGTAVVFNSGTSTNFGATFDSTNNKVVIAYTNASNSSYGTAIVGTVSGTSISFGTPVVFESDNTSFCSAVYDSNSGKVVITYRDYANSEYGTCVVFSVTSTSTNLTTENYIGIAAEAIANTATGKINVVAGTNSGQTGLTTAQKYFVQPNGTLATSAGSPSVVAGTAISSTKIVVQKS